MTMFHWEASARHAAARFQNVRCEKCKQHYHYPIFREAVGRYASSFEDSAAAGAANLAEARVIAAVERGVEIVPCPACGWVQGDMVQEMRRRTARPLHWLGIVLAAAAALVVLCWAGQRLFVVDEGEGGLQPWRLNPMWPAGLAAAAAAAFVLLLLLQRRVDPNRDYPSPRAREIPGAVLAIPGKASAALIQRH
jgi:hypothetical protein